MLKVTRNYWLLYKTKVNGAGYLYYIATHRNKLINNANKRIVLLSNIAA